MDIASGAGIGIVIRYLFDAIKRALHLSDASAAWGMLVFTLLSALGWNLIKGSFAGLAFDPTDLSQSLSAIGAAWATILGTAQGWYAISKPRTPVN